MRPHSPPPLRLRRAAPGRRGRNIDAYAEGGCCRLLSNSLFPPCHVVTRHITEVLTTVPVTAVMQTEDEDVFDSVTWESASAPYDVDHAGKPAGPGFKQSTAGAEEPQGPHDPKWEGYLITIVKDPVKELAETKDAYVSYLVVAKVHPVSSLSASRANHARKTNLPIFSSQSTSARRRFQDFVFLRDHLVRDFPACVVPALPDKHRLGETSVNQPGRY